LVSSALKVPPLSAHSSLCSLHFVYSTRTKNFRSEASVHWREEERRKGTGSHRRIDCTHRWMHGYRRCHHRIGAATARGGTSVAEGRSAGGFINMTRVGSCRRRRHGARGGLAAGATLRATRTGYRRCHAKVVPLACGTFVMRDEVACCALCRGLEPVQRRIRAADVIPARHKSESAERRRRDRRSRPRGAASGGVLVAQLHGRGLPVAGQHALTRSGSSGGVWWWWRARRSGGGGSWRGERRERGTGIDGHRSVPA
jgi:hypothetical protein